MKVLEWHTNLLQNMLKMVYHSYINFQIHCCQTESIQNKRQLERLKAVHHSTLNITVMARDSCAADYFFLTNHMWLLINYYLKLVSLTWQLLFRVSVAVMITSLLTSPRVRDRERGVMNRADRTASLQTITSRTPTEPRMVCNNDISSALFTPELQKHLN